MTWYSLASTLLFFLKYIITQMYMTEIVFVFTNIANLQKRSF